MPEHQHSGNSYSVEKEIRQGAKDIQKCEQKREAIKRKCESLSPDRVLLAGCGSSHKVAMILASKIRESGIESMAIESSELVFGSYTASESDLVVGISQSGETTETVQALREYSKSGATTLALVRSEESTLGNIADIEITTPSGEEKAVVATKTVDTALKTGLMVKEAVAGEHPETFDIGIPKEENVSEAAQVLEKAENAYCLGIGPYGGIAGEAAAKLDEVALIHSTHMSALEFSHRAKSHAEKTPVILLALQPDLEETYKELIKELNDSGAKTILISPEETSYGQLPEVQISAEENLFSSLKIVQKLSVETGIKKDLNPDNPPNLSKITRKQNI